MPGDLGEEHRGSRTALLWQAKPSPLFYVLLRNDADWLGILFYAAGLLFMVHMEQSPGVIGSIIIFAFAYYFAASIWYICRFIIESTKITYQFDGKDLIEHVGRKTKETGSLHYTLAKSRHYCLFGYCCFHFKMGERQFLAEALKKLSFQPKPHTTIEEVETGDGIYGIRKEDADRLQEVLQTLKV